MAFHLPPRQGVQAYKTYAVHTVPGVHTREISCKEAECIAYLRGWRTTVDASTALGRKQAKYIQTQSGRHFTLERAEGMLTFTFPAGQECFATHTEQVRPGLYVVRDGDHRGNPTGRRAQMSERGWLDDFGEHQQKLADLQKRG